MAHQNYDAYQSKYSLANPRKSDIHLLRLIEMFADKRKPLIDVDCRTGNFLALVDNSTLIDMPLYGIDIEGSSISIARSRNLEGAEFIAADVLKPVWVEKYRKLMSGGKHCCQYFTVLF